jgi:hypothetical protein
MGSVCAKIDEYSYTCHVGDNISTSQVMEDLGNPHYMSMYGLNDVLHKCPYLQCTGNSHKLNNDYFEANKPGTSWYKVVSRIGDDDHLTMILNKDGFIIIEDVDKNI